MNEQDYQARHSALEILIKSTWKQVDAEQDQDMRATLMQRADHLQGELIALETQFAKPLRAADVRTWPAPDGSGDTLIELDDGKRFRQSGDKIRRLPEPVEPEPKSPWIAYHDQLIKEWFDSERALIDDLYPSKPRGAENVAFPWPGVATLVLTLACLVIATLYLWA